MVWRTPVSWLGGACASEHVSCGASPEMLAGAFNTEEAPTTSDPAAAAPPPRVELNRPASSASTAADAQLDLAMGSLEASRHLVHDLDPCGGRMHTLLVIEDDALVRRSILDLLKAEGYRGIGAEDGRRGVELALAERPDLVICDVSRPGIDGYEVYELLNLQPLAAMIPFIFLSADADRADRRRGMARGADDSLTEPFPRVELLDSIRARLRRGDEAASQRERSAAPRAKTDPPRLELIVEDAKMKELVAQLERVARAPISLLILGETGVGKKLLAEWVHACSGRSGAFVAFSCAGLNEALLERELFGHEPSAFDQAGEAKEGLLETANGGTLFLDEVGELQPSAQMKLLRVLEERKVLRVGGRIARRIDLRLIAATHRELDRALDEGQFRADLYYRLNGCALTVPALRERRADLEALARHFVRNAPRDPRRTVAPHLSEAVLAALASYRWPGNVRELRGVLERAVLSCEGPALSLEQLPAKLRDAAPARASRAHPIDRRAQLLPNVEKLDRTRVLEALAQCGGNQTHAADLLGISRRTLVTRLRQYGLPRPRSIDPRNPRG